MSYLTVSRGRRQAVAVIASLAVATIGLTACSSGGGGGGTTERVSQADIDKALQTPTKLTMWAWTADTQDEVDLFTKAYPAIQVEVINVGQGADHYAKLRAALQAGEGAPDVAQIEFQHVQSFALGGNLLDLTPYIPEDAGDQFVPWVWEQVKSTDGSKVWSVPWDSGPTALLYRDDILKDKGIEVPTTWDEFATAAKALHEADPSVYLTNMPGNDPGQWVSLMWQAGSRPFGYDGDKTVTIKVNDDASKKVAEYWQGLIQEGSISVDADFNDAWYQGLANGKYASWVPAAAWGPIFLQGTAGNTSGLWRAATLPQWEAGQDVTGNWGGSSMAVLAGSKNKIASAQLVYWLNTNQESTQMFAAKQFLFPVNNETLGSSEFADQKMDFYGGQEVNKFFAEVGKSVDTGFQWLPFMDYAYSAFNETVGAAISESGDIVGSLDAWQSNLVDYAKQQGFTVAE